MIVTAMYARTAGITKAAGAQKRMKAVKSARDLNCQDAEVMQIMTRRYRMKIEGQIKMAQDEAEYNNEKMMMAKRDMRETNDDEHIVFLHNVESFYRQRRDAFRDVVSTLEGVRRLRDMLDSAQSDGCTNIMFDIDRIREVMGWDMIQKNDTTD